MLLANTKKNICFKTTTKHSQRKQELYWQMQRQGVKMSNYFFFICGSTLRSLWPWPCTRDSIFAPEIIIGSEFRFYFGSHTSLILRKHKGLANWYEIWWQCHINFCIVPSLFLFCFFSLLQTKWIFRTVHRQQILQCFGGIIWWWQAGHSNFYL